MFYPLLDCYPTAGQISDYSYCPVMKAKSIDFYVAAVPLVLTEAVMFNALTQKLPVGLPYGVRVRVWSEFYPNEPFMGEMVSFDTIDELGRKETHMIPYEQFDMNIVPWDLVVA